MMLNEQSIQQPDRVGIESRDAFIDHIQIVPEYTLN